MATPQAQFVVDNSVVMAWAFEDENDPYADDVLGTLGSATAVVPVLWPFEVANVLWVAERRGRIRRAESARFLALLQNLPIRVAQPTAAPPASGLLTLCRDLAVSAYDAAYLDLALREALPLATTDTGLRRAARRAGVVLYRVPAAAAGSPPSSG